MKVFKVWPGADLNPCCENTLDAVSYWLDMAESGDTIKIEVLEMTEAEYEAMPEYTGP